MTLADLEAAATALERDAATYAHQIESEKRNSSEKRHEWLTVRGIEQRMARTVREIQALGEPWPPR